MIHHVIEVFILKRFMFFDVRSLFYFIIKIIVTIWQNVKILNGRMITGVAGRYMLKNG